MAIGQSTTLSSTAKTLVIPGPQMKLLTIQNNGSNNVRLSFDGGASFTPTVPGAGSGNATTKGTNPTTTTGYRLAAGAEVDVTSMTFNGGLHAPIVGIMETGSTTLDFTSDDIETTFPLA